MTKSTDIYIRHVSTDTQQIDYRTPIKFGGRIVNDVVLLNVCVEVETRDGRRGVGRGSMTMGNVWAWPTSALTGEQTLEAMIAMGHRIAAGAREFVDAGHPLEITHDLAQTYDAVASEITSSLGMRDKMPRLAQMVAASPLESALHDAMGNVLNQNAYNVLGAEFTNRDLGDYLNGDFSGEYLDRYTLRTPKRQMPLYHLVGALDALSELDAAARLNDGLPETLGEWIEADRLTHLKIKLAGDDMRWDIQRVLEVERVSAQTQNRLKQQNWNYSLDFNEKCANVEYVLEFLGKLREGSPQAFDRVQYIEQPTHRDLRAHPDNKMHQAARIKPVVIDESLVDLDSLLLSREQGYSGVALKACKGHTEALLMGAAAQKYNLFLCVQDLTCVGASFLHSASIAARIPTVAAIEGNGRQYCPAGNLEWEDRYPGMFGITDGSVHTGELSGIGLGFSWN